MAGQARTEGNGVNGRQDQEAGRQQRRRKNKAEVSGRWLWLACFSFPNSRLNPVWERSARNAVSRARRNRVSGGVRSQTGVNRSLGTRRRTAPRSQLPSPSGTLFSYDRSAIDSGSPSAGEPAPSSVRALEVAAMVELFAGGCGRGKRGYGRPSPHGGKTRKQEGSSGAGEQSRKVRSLVVARRFYLSHR
jgi:hypothetical protein